MRNELVSFLLFLAFVFDAAMMLIREPGSLFSWVVVTGILAVFFAVEAAKDDIKKFLKEK